MPDFVVNTLRLSDWSSLLFLAVVLVVAVIVVGFLVRDYFVTRKRVRRFYQKKRPPHSTPT